MTSQKNLDDKEQFIVCSLYIFHFNFNIFSMTYIEWVHHVQEGLKVFLSFFASRSVQIISLQ